MSSLKSMIKIIRFFASIIAIAIVALILVQKFSNNKISIGGIRLFTVITESMVPEYNVGDVLLVKYEDPKKATSYMIGDDIAYQGEVDDYAGKVITHRLIKINEKNGERLYTTKGISPKVENEDPEITGDQIYGKVVTKLYIMSFLSSIINNNYGMYFLIVIPLAFIVFTEFRGYKKDKEEMLKEDDDRYDDDYDDRYDDRYYDDRYYDDRYYDEYDDRNYKKINNNTYDDDYYDMKYEDRKHNIKDYRDRYYDDYDK